MAVTQLNTSTLSEAITADQNEFAVASTANISVDNILVIREEAVKVQEIPISGRVKVMRGWNGTRARSHANGQRFFIGAPEKFKAIKDSLTGLVGDAGVYPDYPLPGQRARDGAGNEYVLCDLTATAYGGSTVAISPDGNFTCTPLKGGTHQGSVGILVEPGTSDQYVWVQIYGYNSYAQTKTATTGVTSAFIPTATTTVSSPDVGLEPLAAATTVAQYFIHGMFIVGAGSSSVTSATSSTGYYVPVFLHYPFVYSRLQSEETSNS